MMAKGQRGKDNRVERKTIEKNRRIHMKGLCFKLASLVPRNHDTAAAAAAAAAAATAPKEEPTQLDQLDEATAYIKKLQARIDELQTRKQEALGGTDIVVTTTTTTTNGVAGCTAATNGYDDGHQQHQQQEQLQKEPLPLVDVRVVDTLLEVVLVSPAQSTDSFTIFYQVMEALEEHGAKVANAGFSLVKDKMFCTIHAQVAVPEASMKHISVAVTERLTDILR